MTFDEWWEQYEHASGLEYRDAWEAGYRSAVEGYRSAVEEHRDHAATLPCRGTEGAGSVCANCFVAGRVCRGSATWGRAHAGKKTKP